MTSLTLTILSLELCSYMYIIIYNYVGLCFAKFRCKLRCVVCKERLAAPSNLNRQQSPLLTFPCTPDLGLPTGLLFAKTQPYVSN